MDRLNRFLVFAGNCYYPHGGWSDFQDSFDELLLADCRAQEEAKRFDKKSPGDEGWGEVVDSRTKNIIAQYVFHCGRLVKTQSKVLAERDSQCSDATS